MDDDVEGTSPTPVARGSHVQPPPALALGLLVLFVACIALVLHSVGSLPVGGVPSTSVVHPTTTTTTTTVPRARVLVQVANGTDHSGYARTFTTEIQTHGWDVLPPINGRSAPTTVVYYKPGFKWAAVLIDKSISAPASAVHALGKNKPYAGTQFADVVVLLGNNA